jgi:hypothetical protein
VERSSIDAHQLISQLQWAASKGYHVLPTNWLQQRVKSVNVRRALTENIPFKASFGSTLFIAAFLDFNTPEW